MNGFLQELWPWIEGSHQMRTALLDILTDTDLAFSPGGQNMTLGALCREFGEIEHSYTESLKTFKQDFKYRNTDPGLEMSVSRLKSWFQSLDDEMKAAASTLTEDDFTKIVERSSGYAMPIRLHFDVYLQALLI